VSNTWYDKVGRIPRKVILALTLVVLAFPIFVPMNLPLAVSEPTKIMFDDIAALEGTGSEVLIVPMTMAPHWGEFLHMYFAVVQHIFLMDDVKLIIAYVGAPDSPPLFGQMFDIISNPLNKQYGVDYVNMPFLPQRGAAFASMADDFRGTYTKDQLGTPIDELPVWDGIYGLDDFEIIVTGDPVGGGRNVARVWFPRFPGLNYYGLALSGAYMGFAPYLGIVFKSGMWGVRPGAEYQQLFGGPYSGALVQTDALSAITFFCLVLIILGNISIIVKKLGGK
jgi:hypothetical protein